MTSDTRITLTYPAATYGRMATRLQTVATAFETLELMLYDNGEAENVVRAGRCAMVEFLKEFGASGAPERPEGAGSENSIGGSRGGVRRRFGGRAPGGRTSGSP